MQAWGVDADLYVPKPLFGLTKLNLSVPSWELPIDTTQDLFEAEHPWSFADDVHMSEPMAEGSVGPGRGDILPLPSSFDFHQEQKPEPFVAPPAPQGKRRESCCVWCEDESMELPVVGVNLCRIDSELCHVMNNVLIISFVALLPV